MPSLRPVTLAVALLAVAIVPANAAQLTPAAGERVVSNAAIIGAEFQQALERPTMAGGVNFSGFVDPTSGARVYHRDGGILIAISTKRNLLLRERVEAERQAAEIAGTLIKERFSALFQTEAGVRGLDGNAVRVVFVEPDATSPAIRGGAVVGAGSWYGAPSRLWNRVGAGVGGGATGCGACAGVATESAVDGFGSGGLGSAGAFGTSGPRAFAPAGFWAGSGGHAAPCTGCH